MCAIEGHGLVYKVYLQCYRQRRPVSAICMMANGVEQIIDKMKSFGFMSAIEWAQYLGVGVKREMAFMCIYCSNITSDYNIVLLIKVTGKL